MSAMKDRIIIITNQNGKKENKWHEDCKAAKLCLFVDKMIVQVENFKKSQKQRNNETPVTDQGHRM